MKNLHIAIIAPQPFIEIRGTSLASLRLAQILANGGHFVDVITYPFGAAEEYPGIKIHRCRPLALIRSVGIGFSLAKLLMDFSPASLALKLARQSSFDCADPGPSPVTAISSDMSDYVRRVRPEVKVAPTSRQPRVTSQP